MHAVRTLMLLTALGACGNSKSAGPSPATPPAPSTPPAATPQPPATAFPATVTALVCVRCTGPHAIDAEGHAIATIYLTVEASAPISGLRLAAVELTDDGGTLVTRGTPGEYLGIVTDPPVRDLGRFAGDLGAGQRIVLWTGATLDIQDAALGQHAPTRYRLRLVAGGGVSLEVVGAMMPVGNTG